MANFYKAFKLLKGIEFNSCKDLLHKNKGETGLTFYGIYEKAHPNWEGWADVKKMVNKYNNLRRASSKLCKNPRVLHKVKNFYKVNYWDKFRGDEIPQTIANEIFIFYLHTGKLKKAVKMAQKAAGMPRREQDGIIGSKTIAHFNKMCPNALERFSMLYDIYEKSFYKRLVHRVKRLRWALKGFLNRAEKV